MGVFATVGQPDFAYAITDVSVINERISSRIRPAAQDPLLLAVIVLKHLSDDVCVDVVFVTSKGGVCQLAK